MTVKLVDASRTATRAAVVWGVLVAALLCGAVAYWMIWDLGFVFLLPFARAMVRIRERTGLLAVDGAAAFAGAAASWLTFLAAGLVFRRRFRMSLPLSLAGWMLAALAPGRLLAWYHPVPATTLPVQMAVTGVVLLPVVFLARKRP